jgi:hypothetical protein
VRASACRVVSAVPQHQRPGAPELVRGSRNALRDRLGVPFEQRLDPSPLQLLVHARGHDVREQVRPGARAELSLPDREIGELASLQVIPDASDLRLDPGEVGGAEPLRERRVRSCVVVTDHDHEAVVDHVRAHPVDVVPDRSSEVRGSLGLHQRSAAEVAERHVLAQHLGAAVGRSPTEGRPVDPLGHAAPDHRPPEPLIAQDPRHLTDVAELVGEVPAHRVVSERARPLEAHPEVANVRLTRDEELVHLRDPGPGGEAPLPHVPRELGAPLRPAREVVVDHRRLSVQMEMWEPRGGEVEQCVHHRHEPLDEDIERLVPLAVPVGVRDERDADGHRGGSLVSPARSNVPRAGYWRHVAGRAP